VDRVEPRIVLSPRPDATPDSSRSAIARCYVYLVQRYWLRKEAERPVPDSHDDVKKDENAHAATKRIANSPPEPMWRRS
jgi:endonuclease I